MRIAQAVRPDLGSRALDRYERIVFRDPVAPVLTDGGRRGVLAQVGDDAEDLADERVEPLRIQPARVALFAGAGVAGAEVHHPPIGIAGPGDRIEHHLARSDGCGVGCRTRRISRAVPSNVAFAGFRSFHSINTTSRSTVRGTVGVRIVGVIVYPERSRPATTPVSARRVGRNRRVLHVDRVEHAVTRVVGIELEVGEPGGEVPFECEFLKQPRPSAETVEVEIRGEGLLLLVEDVERAVEIVDKEPLPAAGLVSHEVHAGELSARVLALELAGDRKGHVVFQLERQAGRRLHGRRAHQRDRERKYPESRGPSSVVASAHDANIVDRDVDDDGSPAGAA